jgi:hypothetical protein
MRGENLMADGPGKYDDLCTYVREQTQASAVVVIVVDGKKGSGFSVQAHAPMTLVLPEMLEQIARDLRGEHHYAH